MSVCASVLPSFSLAAAGAGVARLGVGAAEARVGVGAATAGAGMALAAGWVLAEVPRAPVYLMPFTTRVFSARLFLIHCVQQSFWGHGQFF